MSGRAGHDTPTLAFLILFGIANHSVLTGSRVIVSLNALSSGASPFTVGVLMSLYSVLPMFFAVAAGRLSDRIGTRRPLGAGAAVIAVGAALPVAFPGLPALYASATLLGVGFMAVQIAARFARRNEDSHRLPCLLESGQISRKPSAVARRIAWVRRFRLRGTP